MPEFPQDARQSFSTLLSVQGILALLLVPFIGGALGGLCGAQGLSEADAEDSYRDPDSGGEEA